jgi:CrcB protein
MREIALIASFGAVGAVARYGIGVLATRLLGGGFAYGTLAVNLVGCFLLGVVVAVFNQQVPTHNAWRAALGIGFLGALTTFSTFGVETFAFLEKQRYMAAALNVGGNLIVGLLCVWAGVALGRMIASP